MVRKGWLRTKRLTSFAASHHDHEPFMCSTRWHARARLFLSIPLLITGLPAPAAAQNTLSVTGLRHEYRIQPAGNRCTASAPELAARKAAKRKHGPVGIPASGCHRLVGSDQGQKGLLWDSGRVVTGRSLFQTYNGPALRSRTRLLLAGASVGREGETLRVERAGILGNRLAREGGLDGTVDRPSAASRGLRQGPAAPDAATLPSTSRGRCVSARVYVTESWPLRTSPQRRRRISGDFFTPG